MKGNRSMKKCSLDPRETIVFWEFEAKDEVKFWGSNSTIGGTTFSKRIADFFLDL